MAEQAAPVTRSTTPLHRASEPFRFCTSLILQEATGLRAATLSTLAKLLRIVPDACIYHHTHYFLLSHHYLTPEPTNDFACWVGDVLGEEPLGELLASIDIMEYHNLQGLRATLVSTIETYLQEHPLVRLKFVSEGAEFFFVKSVHVIMPTSYTAWTLAEFAEALGQISIHSLYFHIFDARLRLGHPTNDFALWLTGQLGLQELGKEVSRLDPYAHTLETLRSILLALIRRELVQREPTDA
jgi:hypothetical protein